MSTHEKYMKIQRKCHNHDAHARDTKRKRDEENIRISQTPRKKARGRSGPEIAHLELTDHDMLYCAMAAILVIRSNCL